MKIVFLVILSFLAIVGISHIVFEIFYRFTKIKDDHSFVLVIKNQNGFLDAEFTIRSVVAKLKKLGKNSVNDIVVLSDNLDSNTKKSLEILKKDYEYLQILTKEDFIKFAGL